MPTSRPGVHRLTCYDTNTIGNLVAGPGSRSQSAPLHSFGRGVEQDHDAVVAALTTSYHNGRTEGVNTRTKMLKRQMYGRAGFDLLRHRILHT